MTTFTPLRRELTTGGVSAHTPLVISAIGHWGLVIDNRSPGFSIQAHIRSGLQDGLRSAFNTFLNVAGETREALLYGNFDVSPEQLDHWRDRLDRLEQGAVELARESFLIP